MNRWPHRRPGRARRARIRFSNHPFKLAERMDPLYLAALLLGAAILGVSWFVGVRLTTRLDRSLDNPVRALPDERLLTNVRDGLPQREVLDATFHEADGRLYLSQDGGQIHSYDPETGLWKFEMPYGKTAPINPRFVTLQSGCGGLEPCPDGESLWALSDEGGLARKRDGGWELVVSDTSFQGADGLPVDQTDLICAAISSDGIWLVVGTRSQGFGLYALDRHRWVRLSASFFQVLPSLVIERAVWWRGRFWLGGPNGLAMLDMRDISLHSVPDIDGKILDVAADEDGALWVLERKACSTPGLHCQQLWAFTGPDAEPEVRLDEVNRFSELSMDRLHFAMQQDRHLFVAGEAGVFSYDTDLHRWARHLDLPIGPALAMPEAGGFYYGYSGGVGWRDGEKDAIWPLEGERFAQLTPGRDGEVLGLTYTGGVYVFRPGEDHRLVFSGKGSALDPKKFTAAVAMGDQVLFTGPEGAMLHDVKRRTYQDFKNDPSMAWLTDDKGQLITSGDDLYVLGQAGEALMVKTISQAKVQAADFRRPYIYPPMAGSATAARAWSRGGIGFLDGGGRLVHLDRQNVSRLTGPAIPNLNGETLVDVVSTGRDLLFATSKGLRTYDKKTRAWGDLELSPSGSAMVELAEAGGEVFIRDADNRLVRRGPYRPVLIGEGGPSKIREGQLTDVWGDMSGIYMAGGGHLEYYDLGLRSFTGRWRIPQGNTRVVGQVNGRPLALTNGSATWGDQILGPINEPVLSLFNDQRMIWMVRRNREHRYLRGAAMGGEGSQCLFRRPTLGAQVREVTDAAHIGDGVVAAATNDGLRFYDPRARSWFLGPKGVLPRGGWIFELDDYLLFLERENGKDRLWIAARRSIRLPGSCSDEPVSFEPEVFTGKGTTVDRKQALVAWIDDRGMVLQWRQGRVRERLPEEPRAPELSNVSKMAFQREHQALLMVIDDNLWRYTLATRAWERIQTRGGGSGMNDWNLEPAGPVTVLTATSSDGTLYMGELAAGAIDFEWIPIYQARVHQIGQPGKELMDVVIHADGTWAFLMRDRILWFNPSQRRWIGRFQFPTSRTDRVLHASFGRWVCIEKETGVWWIARDNTGHPEGMARLDTKPGFSYGLDENGAIWQLDPGGILEKAAMPKGAAYADFTTISGKPFVLETNAPPMAISWQDLVVFDLGNGLAAYDELAFREVSLPAAVRNLRLRAAPRLIDGDLWLLGDDLLVVLQKTESGRLIDFKFPGIESIAVDRDGQVWAFDGSKWQFWRNGGLQRLRRVHGVATDLVREVWVADGHQAMAIGPTGDLMGWQAQDARFQALGVTLANGTLPGQPWGLLPGAGGQWWAWGGFGMARLRSTDCAGGTCLNLEKVWQAPAAGWAKRASGITHVQLASGTGLVAFVNDVLFVPALQGGTLTQTQSQPPKANLAVENDWDDVKANAVARDGGGWIYNPITAIGTDEVSLVARRPEGMTLLAERGEVQFEDMPGLDVGWLVWNREQRGFTVKTPSGPKAIPASEFVVDGQLLFEEISAVLAPDPNTLVAANRHGFWRYHTRHLGLDNQTVEFIPKSLPVPIQADRGRFRTGGGSFFADGAPAPKLVADSLTFGDVAISQGEGGRGLAVSIAGQPVPFQSGARGFPWDRNRHQLVWEKGRLQLLSDAGLHDLDAFERFVPLPAGAANSATLHPDASLGIWLDAGGQWFRLQKGAWQAHNAEPGAGRTMVNQPAWQWNAAKGLPGVVLKTGQKTMKWIDSTDGPGFAADRLHDAIYDGQRFVIATQAWVEVADTVTDVERMRGTRRDALGNPELTYRWGSGGPIVVARTDDGGRLTWRPDAQSFETASEAPGQGEVLWQDDRLRFTRRNGVLQKELRLESGWVPFEMESGKFPFDIVTAVAASNGTLYLGSAAGLQTYSSPASLRLPRVTRWWGMAESSAKDFAKVTRIEKPDVDLPLRVFTNDGAFEQAQDRMVPSPPGARESERLRHISPFWRWTQSPGGRLRGEYLGVDGASWQVRIANGRFAHDDLVDVAEVDGRVFALWRNGLVSVGTGTSLTTIEAHFQLTPEPRELLVFPRDVLGERRLMTRGVYALADNAAWRYEGSRWRRIEDVDTVYSLARHAEAPPIYQREHLRLRRPRRGGGFVFEYRNGDAPWKPLIWGERGRLALDRWHGFWSDGQVIWAATDLGLVSFSRDGDGHLVLQPHSFQAIRSLTAAQSAREISDMMVAEDKFWIRCDNDSGKVYNIPVDQLREGSFEKVQADPFASGVYVDGSDGLWEWRWSGRQNGEPGVLQAQMDGEPVSLVAGRFNFDGLTSMAFLQPGVMELTAENGGWFQTDRGEFSLTSLRRPVSSGIDPKEIESLSIGRRDAVVGLCLQRRDGSFWWWVPGQTPEAVVVCAACEGDDGFWRYDRLEDGLRMVGRQSDGGLSERVMARGRFLDDQILGLPVTVRNGNSVSLLMPTLAGVLRRDPQLKVTGIHVGPFAGQPEGAPPSVLAQNGNDGAFYLAADGFHELAGPREWAAGLPADLPQDAVLETAHWERQGVLRLGWQTARGKGWHMLSALDLVARNADHLFLNMSSHDRFVSRRLDWGDPDPWLVASYEPGRLNFTRPNSEAVYSLDIPQIESLVKIYPASDRLLILGSNELLEVRLDQALETLFGKPNQQVRRD